MPQKTKKAKLAAKHRKELKYTIVETEPAPSQEKKKVQASPVTITHEDVVGRNYFIKDFKKSLVFVGFILGLEFFLHFARISNYFLR